MPKYTLLWTKSCGARVPRPVYYLWKNPQTFTNRNEDLARNDKTKKHAERATNRCAFNISCNTFRGIKGSRLTFKLVRAQQLPVVRAEGWRYILTLIHLQRADGFYFNIPKHSEHCGHCETDDKQPPPSLFMPTLSHLDLDIQAKRARPTRPPSFPLTTVSAYDLPGRQAQSPQTVTDLQGGLSVWQWWNPSIVHGCAGLSRVSSHSNQKVLPPALWQSPLPQESLIITCEGGLVIFLIILHFISIPPFKTQHENWLPQRSIFIISHRPINYPTLGQGGRAVQAQADPFHSYTAVHRGGVELNGSALSLAENGKGLKKKYTCYLVNPQTCKIGISWMSATEMELTRDLFIVTEGH